tara:strand:+ start:274 stop:1128 length:855 start_codon:yes stop_codon:yes gene_type:complete
LISQRTLDLVIASEVTSRKTYERAYQRPEWPGGMSGVTIGIGYDLGYSDATKLHADFGGLLPAPMLGVMERCLGVRGNAARSLLPSVHRLIDVPWDVAIRVFMGRSVPHYLNLAKARIPGLDKLPPDCQGVIFSLTYNRGASYDNAGDRYREMRMIKAHIASGNLPAVADDIRDMKRLWRGRGLDGLLARRDLEAKIWAAGLKSSGPAVNNLRVADKPSITLPAPMPSEAVAGTAAAASATTATAVQGVHWGWIAFGVVLAIAIFFAIRQIASTPAVARQKDAP